MKIALLILGMDCGGSERAAASLCNYFVSKNNDVSLYVLTGDKSFYHIDERVNVVFFNSSLERKMSVKRLFDIFGRMKLIRKTVKKARPDVLIGMSYIMSLYAALCTCFLKTASIGTERANPYEYKAGFVSSLVRKTGAVLCDGNVYQTRAAMEFFPECTHKKSAIIQNAVFNEKVYEISAPAVREKTIVAVGRLIYEKGFDILIDAFLKIADKIPEYRLVIIGDGEERCKLEEKIRQSRAENRIFLPGTRHDAVEVAARSSLFVLSSRCEGMPNALLEAMSCGCACVSTDCRMGPGEIITDGEDGILVKPEDADALSEAMLRVLTDGELSRKISLNAVKIKEKNSIDSIGEQWLKYISSLKRKESDKK